MIYIPLSCHSYKLEKVKKKVAWRESGVTRYMTYEQHIGNKKRLFYNLLNVILNLK